MNRSYFELNGKTYGFELPLFSVRYRVIGAYDMLRTIQRGERTIFADPQDLNAVFCACISVCLRTIKQQHLGEPEPRETAVSGLGWPSLERQENDVVKHGDTVFDVLMTAGYSAQEFLEVGNKLFDMILHSLPTNKEVNEATDPTLAQVENGSGHTPE